MSSATDQSDIAAGVPALLLEAAMQRTEELLAQYAGLWPSQRKAADAAVVAVLDAGVAVGGSTGVMRRVALAMLAAAALPAPLAGWAGTSTAGVVQLHLVCMVGCGHATTG